MNRQWCIWLWSLAILLPGVPALTQVSVSASLDSTGILIGDQVDLHVFVEHGEKVTLESIDLSSLRQVKGLEVIKEAAPVSRETQGKVFVEQRITLTSFDSGYIWIPRIPVRFRENGQSREAFTESLPLTVHTFPSPVDSVRLQPIKPIVEEPLRFRDVLPLLGGLLAMAAMAGLFYWLRRRERGITTTVAIPKPPHERALEQLYALRDAKLWQQGEIKGYHSRLTYIIREYLEGRFRIPALENTTEEILHALDRQGEISESLILSLRHILQTADLVKFAKATPGVSFHEEAFRAAERFVLETRPEEPDPAPNPSVEEAPTGEPPQPTA